MAQRLIDSSFLSDSWILSLSKEERLAYLGLILSAEGSGCLKNDAIELKMRIFPNPADKVSIHKMTAILLKFADAGKLVPYGNDRYLYIASFPRFQKQDKVSRPQIPLPSWLSWEPYPTNPYQGRIRVEGKGQEHFLVAQDITRATSEIIRFDPVDNFMQDAGIPQKLNDDSVISARSQRVDHRCSHEKSPESASNLESFASAFDSLSLGKVRKGNDKSTTPFSLSTSEQQNINSTLTETGQNSTLTADFRYQTMMEACKSCQGEADARQIFQTIGLDNDCITEIFTSFSTEQIIHQVHLFPLRGLTPTGSNGKSVLIRSIEENWPGPGERKVIKHEEE